MLGTKNICFAIICTLSCLTHNFLEPAMVSVENQQEKQKQKNAIIIPFVRKRFAGESILTQTGSALSWSYYSLFSMLGKKDPNVLSCSHSPLFTKAQNCRLYAGIIKILGNIKAMP